MAELMSFLKFAMTCGTILVVCFTVALALPKSELRTLVLRVCYLGAAVFCGAYCISPVDILPEAALGPAGLFDDLGVGIGGLIAAKRAVFPGNN